MRRRSWASTRNTYRTWKRMVGTVKKSTETSCWMWLSRNVRHVWLGDFRGRTIYLLTLVSPISIPSLSNSPWMRGAPQSGLARLMVRIRSRTSCETAGLPVCPCRIFQVQNNRKPFRCQAMTVSGLTMTSADLQSAQALDNHAQKTRSATVNFGRFLAERRSTPIWCRSATISTWRAACERQTENIVERKGHRTLNIGLASPFRILANLMISERLKFPRTTVARDQAISER